MHPPDEMMLDTFLPAMRQLVSVRLRAQGYTQSEVSKMLGVTQASVSLYLSADPRRAYNDLELFSIGKEESDRYANLLAEDVKRSMVDAQATLESVWNGILGRGQGCALHRRMHPSLADCDMCMKEFGFAGESRLDSIAEVQDAAKSLGASPFFADAMPQVSVNIAYSPTDSQSPDDVVAVPGRIVKVRGRAASSMRPEFGASSHLARVLLLVRRKRGDVRCAINLRYDARMQRALKKLRLAQLDIGGEKGTSSSDPTLDALTASLGRHQTRFDVVVDRGGRGVEPNVYLFTQTPKAAADLALKLAREYSAG